MRSGRAEYPRPLEMVVRSGWIDRAAGTHDNLDRWEEEAAMIDIAASEKDHEDAEKLCRWADVLRSL